MNEFQLRVLDHCGEPIEERTGYKTHGEAWREAHAILKAHTAGEIYIVEIYSDNFKRRVDFV